MAYVLAYKKSHMESWSKAVRFWICEA